MFHDLLEDSWNSATKCEESFHHGMVALGDAFYIEKKRSDLDTLRVPNRSPTPISKSNDFLGQSDDI